MTQISDDGFVDLRLNGWCFIDGPAGLTLPDWNHLPLGVLVRGIAMNHGPDDRTLAVVRLGRVYGPQSLIDLVVRQGVSDLELKLLVGGEHITAFRLSQIVQITVGWSSHAEHLQVLENLTFWCHRVQVATHPDVLKMVNGWKKWEASDG